MCSNTYNGQTLLGARQSRHVSVVCSDCTCGYAAKINGCRFVRYSYKLQNPAYCFTRFLKINAHMIPKNILWLAPFICFLSGYFIVRSLFHINTIPTPSAVGRSLQDAFTILSNHNLNIRLLTQKENSDLPNGTIISQVPSPGQMVKPRQTIFLALSKQPPIATTPYLVGKSYNSIAQELNAAKIRFKLYSIESPYPINTCIAQSPSPAKPLTNTILTIYLSKEYCKPVIWPNFVGRPVDDVLEFLDQYSITPHIIEKHHKHKSPTPSITDQRPLAGSLIILDQKQPPIVQLHVQ